MRDKMKRNDSTRLGFHLDQLSSCTDLNNEDDTEEEDIEEPRFKKIEPKYMINSNNPI